MPDLNFADASLVMSIPPRILQHIRAEARRAVAEEAERRIKDIRPDVATLDLSTEQGLSLFARARGMNDAIGVLRAIAREHAADTEATP